MKKIFNLIIATLLSVMLFSCGGNDEPEPEKSDEITRVQDGNGKVFIDNGVLVEANIDYTSAQLTKALAEHEWAFDYGFYYDNHHVSSKAEMGSYCPTFIHTNGTIEYSNFSRVEGRICAYGINGKELITKSQASIHSSYSYPSDRFVIIALDYSEENGGRMIMDEKLGYAPFNDYDANSSYKRLVWTTLPGE